MKNGELLNAAEREGFEIFVTADAAIVDEYKGPLAVIVLPTNRRRLLDAMTDLIRVAVDGVRPGERRKVPLPPSP